ncbi:hypothetical protein [Chryseobacterium viscerum]|uniref:Abortive infection protein-like C-terminal domain-containing protein n=1 Tax=Chryseobacterium viscerum TaxID=1037377 RepID=A0A5N4BQZ8_9FLAO|nr:hypothetical protein [Chryseobacterium viscerum]KAB1230848.1 hypothetical protein F8D52_10670 [Chryseobacterium viscerum]
MNEENYLRHQILIGVSNITRTHNIRQLEGVIMNQISDFENYKAYYNKAFNYLKNNGFINTSVNNIGTDTVESLTEKGEAVLKFNSWEDYLENKDKGNKTNISVPTKYEDVLSINENGHLIFNEELLLKKISEKKSNNSHFIDPNRLIELRNITNNNFDLSRLIRFCEEIDDAFLSENYLSVGMLLRGIIDHIPPIFGCKNFSEVTNNYNGSKSFKKSMEHLNVSLRNISDSYLHTHIRKKESLPNKTQIDFSRDLDVLLSEIIRIS